MKYRPSTEGQEIVKPDYRKKIIFSLNDFEEKGHLLQVVTIPPETRQRLHSHEKQTEVFYILEGEATLTINNVDYVARPGDAFICSPGDIHNVWNKTGRDFKLVVFKINLPEGEDSVWLE
ncbi:MAG TPA: cupin domain-containing protein [Anaerolineales bacterium]|jgi:quercetin dioxygenase-like cupin family protein|nr:cupin domain-containing protein [Anaerolineales bacterium]